MTAVTFAGQRLPDGSFVVDPGFVVDAEATDSEGPVEVVAIGRRGRRLATTRLPLEPPCAPRVSGADRPGEIAVGLAELPQGTVSLEMRLDGQVVWQRDAPATATDFKVTWPGRFRRDHVGVPWESSTEDCLAALAFSPDDGATWLPLTLPTAERRITADLSDLPGGTACLLELCLTDGFTTQRLRSAAFELSPGGWRLAVLSPQQGAVLASGLPVALAAQAYDVDTRTVSGEITWESSVDGVLGSGPYLVVALSPGEHVVTARAHDLAESVTVSLE